MGKHYRIPLLLCLCVVAAHAQIPGLGTGVEPVSNFLAKVALWFSSAPARLIVVIGIAFGLAQMMFGDHHSHSSMGRILIAAAGLFGLQTLVAYWIG